MNMKKYLPLAFAVAGVFIGIIACNSQSEEIDGEVLVKEVWNAMATCNIDYLENIMDPVFRSVHEDGSRNKNEEIELIKNLNLNQYELSDFNISKNMNIMNISYWVSVTETIDEVTYTRKSARLSVFSKTAEGWKWISHANVLPLTS